MTTFLAIALALLTILAVSLQRTYARISLKELKYRARSGDELAAAILRAAGYGHSLRAVLWFLIGISAASFFVVVALDAPPWFALSASAILIWLSFVWLPAARITVVSERIAAWLAPFLAWLLVYIHPFSDRIMQFIRRHRPVTLHTGLYDRYDLIDLLERQQVQPDNRIEKAELEIALHALTFGDDIVAQHMIPRRAVKSVSADDPLGPIVMDELHTAGHSRFPVYDGKKDNMVGVLFLRDLISAKAGGTVRELMKPGVSYVHEDQSIYEALQAILKTHHQLYVVVNSYEEYAGIITIEDVLETILGKPIVDEFDQYQDMRAVAAKSARRDHKMHTEQKAEATLPAENLAE